MESLHPPVSSTGLSTLAHSPMRAASSIFLSGLLAITAAGMLGGCDDGREGNDAGGNNRDSGPGTDAGNNDGLDSGPLPDSALLDAGAADAAATDAPTPLDAGSVDAFVPSCDEPVPTGSAIDVGDCEEVDIEIAEDCGEFTACAVGEACGSYCYESYCLEQGGLPGVDLCNATILSYSGTMQSRIRFYTGSGARRDQLAALTLSASVPSTSICLFLTDCDGLEDRVNGELGDSGSASCEDAEGGDGGCVCELTLDLDLRASDTFTLSGSEVTLEDAERTFDACRDGDDLSWSETTDDPIEPGITTMVPEASLSD